jgi:hypothetical protein
MDGLVRLLGDLLETPIAPARLAVVPGRWQHPSSLPVDDGREAFDLAWPPELIAIWQRTPAQPGADSSRRGASSRRWIEHDIYHAGEINHIRSLLPRVDRWAYAGE